MDLEGLTNEVISISVGGVAHHTTLQTLTVQDDSMLAAMFSGRWNLPKTRDGLYFIDRDGSHFKQILNHLRSPSSVLPNDETVLEELLEEAKYYQITSLVDRLLSHDMNVRPVHIIYMRKADKKSIPFVHEFRLRDLKRERYSFLARTAQKLYDNGGHHSRVLTIILVDLGRARDDLSSSNVSHSASFYTPATDRTAFADFDSSIAIGRGLQEGTLSILRRGRAREMLLTSALATVFHYLKTGEFTLNFCFNQFRTHLENDYTRLTEDAASGTVLDASREPRVSWIDIHTKMSSASMMDQLLLPLVCDVAEYFGLHEFVRIANERVATKTKPPFLRFNSV